MNILFIYSVDDISSPVKPFSSQAEMQFGISYISSVLKKHGHSTKLIVLSRMLGRRNEKIIDGRVKSFSPELICFTAVSTEYPFISNIAGYIKKKYSGIFLLAGGPHVSLNPEEAMRDGFNALCVSEGEYPTLELASQLAKGARPSRIPNLWIRQGSLVEKNPTRPFLQVLEDLPFPDRKMWQEWIGEKSGSEHSILLGRGCPFNCTYCCNHALRKLAEGRYTRFRPPDDIIKEIKEVISEFPGKTNFYLEVETIGTDVKWVTDLCSKLERLNAILDKPLSYRTNFRITPNFDIDNLFAAFKKGNIKTVNIGLESGSEKIRREILRRNYSNRDVTNTVAIARKYGIKVYFYNLIGVPGETVEDFKETIKINRMCLPDKTFNHIFFPYPGTELYSLCKKRGLLPKAIDTDLERCKAVLDLPGFTKKEVQNSFVWFDYNVYKDNKPIIEILPRVLISKFRSNSRLHSFYRKFTFSFLFKQLKKIF